MENSNVVYKRRDANIELLRIVAMLMVTTIHCIDNGFILKNINELSAFNYVLVNFLRICAGVANGLFILITGYYQINNKFNIKKIGNLWGKTLFYSISIYIILSAINYETNLFYSLFPISTNIYWFISAYIILYFFAPILNILINKLTKNQMKFLLITMLVMFGILKVLLLTEIFDGILINIVMYYILGGYIRKYIDIKPKQKYFIKYLLIVIAVTSLYIILNIISIIISNSIVLNVLTHIIVYFYEYGSILLVMMTVLLFMKFKTIEIKSKTISKFITILSPSVISVYIIQQNIHFRTLWKYDGNIDYKNSIWMLPRMILVIIAVFATCMIIDLIRRGIYYVIKKIPIINSLIYRFNCQLDKINTKLNNYI